MLSTEYEIWAHRGSHDGCSRLENTLSAFVAALNEDCAGIELDVHVSSDGHVVVHHDECLTRLSTNGDTRLVSSLSLEALRCVPLQGGHQIPTLKDVLALVAGRKPLNIEIKDALGVDAVLADLEHYDATQIVLSSFSADAMLHAALKAPGVTRVWISGETSLDPLCEAHNIDPRETLQRVSSDRWHTHGFYATAPLVDALSRQGIPTYVWTVNDVNTALELYERGIQGIFCDQPGRMSREMNRRLSETST